MTEYEQAMRDPRSRLRRRLNALWPAIKFRLRLLYAATLYRPHMRWLHRRGKHWHTRLRPMGGPEMLWCQWCGDRQILGKGQQCPKCNAFDVWGKAGERCCLTCGAHEPQ